jgi:hypothetical protein
MTVSDHSVSRVGAAVEARANVKVLCENVHKLALAFITPLGAEDDSEFGLKASDAPSVFLSERLREFLH